MRLSVNLSRGGLGRALALLAVLLVAACGGDSRPASTTPDVTAKSEKPVPDPGSETFKPAGSAPVEPESRRDALVEAEFYSGTGELLGAGRIGGTGISQLSGGAVTLNFVEADILEVVDVVLGDTLGVNYVIDPRVQGSVTARTSRPLRRDALFAALENILAFSGAGIRIDNDVYAVVPLETLRGSPAGVVVPSGRENAQGFGIHVIPLEFASAAAVQRVVEPFVGQGNVLRVDAARNLLVLAGNASAARSIEEMIQVFDVDWMSGMSFAILPVEVANVESLVADLDVIFGQQGEGPLAGVIRFLPIERLNAILAITSQPVYLRRAKIWVERLDRGDAAAGRRIFVYYVKNGRAQELADVLNEVFAELPGAGGGPPAGSPLAPGLEPAVLESTVPAAEGEEGAAAEAPPVPQFPPPGDIAAAAGVGFGVGALQAGGSNIRIIADERNNALVILSTASEYKLIEATLQRLDILPLQVLIEATIAEVTLSDDLRYGLQWFFQSGNFEFDLTNAAGGAATSAPGFNVLFQSSDARVVLSALAEVTNVKVISSPQLMVLDNQSARLNVGDQVPVATQSVVSTTDPDAPVVNSIQNVDTGVILEVTPHVNASGLVSLEIVQEVSDVTETTTSNIDSPTIQQRRIESTVAVQSNETVALGGLIRDDREESIDGVPILMDIPLFGNLFKTTVEAYRRTELLVLITPRVVRDQHEAREVTDELRQRMSTVIPLQQKID